MSASNGYRTLAELHAAFQALGGTQETVGQSYNGANILAFHFGNPSGGHVMWQGCIHGRECINGELLYQYVLWLKSGSQEANRILQYNYTTIIPSFNIDNYLKNRKNAHIYSKVINGTTYSGGVDLNRNFQNGWVLGNEDPTLACSATRGSQVPSCYNYQGPNAVSEPEVVAMRAFLNKYKPKWFIDMHTGDASTPIYWQCKSTDAVRVKALMDAYSSQYPEYNNMQSGNASMCYNDAFGYSQSRSGLWEFHPTENNDTGGPAASDVATVWFPKFLPFAKAINADVEVVTPNGGGTPLTLALVVGMSIPLLLYFAFMRNW